MVALSGTIFSLWVLNFLPGLGKRPQAEACAAKNNSPLRASGTRQEMNDKGNDRKNQQELNQKSCNVEKYESSDPQQKQDDSNSQKRPESHRSTLL